MGRRRARPLPEERDAPAETLRRAGPVTILRALHPIGTHSVHRRRKSHRPPRSQGPPRSHPPRGRASRCLTARRPTRRWPEQWRRRSGRRPHRDEPAVTLRPPERSRDNPRGHRPRRTGRTPPAPQAPSAVRTPPTRRTKRRRTTRPSATRPSATVRPAPGAPPKWASGAVAPTAAHGRTRRTSTVHRRHPGTRARQPQRRTRRASGRRRRRHTPLEPRASTRGRPSGPTGRPGRRRAITQPRPAPRTRPRQAP